VLCHSGVLFGARGPFPSDRTTLAISYFRFGVDLFFAISGFIITRRLVLEWETTGGISLFGFYRRRAYRILPAYTSYLLVIGALSVLNLLIVENWEWLSAACFVRNYTMGLPGGVATNHFWSLAVEEHFYLLWPLALLAFRPSRALPATVALALAVGGWRAVDSRYHLFAGVFPSLPDAGVLFRSDARMDSLLWGCAAALIFPRLSRIAHRLQRWGSAIPLAILVAIVLVIAAPARMQSIDLAVLFPALVVATVLAPATAFAKVLELGPLRWIGKLSYSLYIWQTLFLQCPSLSQSLGGQAAGWRLAGWWMVDIASIVALAALSYYFVELPMLARSRERPTVGVSEEHDRESEDHRPQSGSIDAG
jgi:peptidoglycan/LPS O-acetylase OafA/YrhL